MIVYSFDTPPDAGQAVTVAPGVLWMRLPLPMALDHVNVYALDEGDGWSIVDTGMDLASGRVRRRILRGLGRRGETQIYVTRGLGTVVLPVRYGCLPEVSVLTLRCAD